MSTSTEKGLNGITRTAWKGRILARLLRMPYAKSDFIGLIYSIAVNLIWWSGHLGSNYVIDCKNRTFRLIPLSAKDGVLVPRGLGTEGWRAKYLLPSMLGNKKLSMTCYYRDALGSKLSGIRICSLGAFRCIYALHFAISVIDY